MFCSKYKIYFISSYKIQDEVLYALTVLLEINAMLFDCSQRLLKVGFKCDFKAALIFD